MVGQLEQDSGAVARVGVGTGRAAMLEVLERLQRAFDRLVPGSGIQPRDERDAARIVLVVGRVETRLRRAPRAHDRPLSWGWLSAGLEIREFTRTQSPRASGVGSGRERRACFKE